MGERQVFQPLTREDRITVVLYRIGIIFSAVVVAVLAYLFSAAVHTGGLLTDILGFALYASVGMSVFFIHLYLRRFKTYLMNLYFISLGCLVMLLAIGNGSPSAALSGSKFSVLLLLPLSGCLGFVTAKEAFCFRILEGYLLALIMPVYLLLVSASVLTGAAAAAGLVLIAVLLVVFTLRKVFMPVAYDIGDKSAYQ